MGEELVLPRRTVAPPLSMRWVVKECCIEWRPIANTQEGTRSSTTAAENWPRKVATERSIDCKFPKENGQHAKGCGGFRGQKME